MHSPSSPSGGTPRAARAVLEPLTPIASRGMRRLSEAVRLLLPVSCAGCGRWDVALCSDCRDLLAGEPRVVEHADAAGALDVMAMAAYAGPVRRMVLGWKNGSREDLAASMEELGIRAGRLWARSSSDKTRAAIGSGPLLVVPAPSGWARRIHGRLVAAAFADAVARGAAVGWSEAREKTRDSDRSLDVLSVDLLRRPRFAGGAHQAGRTARQRRANRTRPPRVLAPVTGLAVLLVDDVVTTGATLGGCARALHDAGARVIGALAVAAAPSPARKQHPVVPGGPVSASGDQCGSAASVPRRTA